jgi:hypothetical protein
MTRLEKHLHVGVAVAEGVGVATTVRAGVAGVAAAQRFAITIAVHSVYDQLSAFGNMTDAIHLGSNLFIMLALWGPEVF